MKKLSHLFIIFSVFFILFSCNKNEIDTEKYTPIKYPEILHFPATNYDFDSNPFSEQKFALGKMLFYDPILSGDSSISCGSCHQQHSAFTQHGHDLSHGIDDLLTMRNAQPIMNLAWKRHFMWDGGVFDLDLFAIAPIEAHNEMGETLSNVLEKINRTPRYQAMFLHAYGQKANTVNFLKSLAQFQLFCVSANSAYDQYIRGDAGALSSFELEGLRLFEQKKCASCHIPPLFTDHQFHNNGLALGNPEDLGRERITLNPADRLKFGTPSLRNAQITAPFMHDGRFKTLEQVLDHYHTGIVVYENLPEQLQSPIVLTDLEKQQLIAFIKTLTDKEFVTKKILAK